jgi:tight adherence protein B
MIILATACAVYLGHKGFIDLMARQLALFQEKKLEPLKTRWSASLEKIEARKLPLIMLIGALGLGGLMVLLSGSLVMGALASALSCLLPWLVVNVAESRAKAAFCARLTDDLDAMASALRAGQSLQQALATVAIEAPKSSAGHWQELATQVRMGTDIESGLDRLALKFPGSPAQADLAILATAVGVNRTAGGNLTEAFQRQAETQRERARLRAQVDALTAQGRMSGWVVGLLPVGLLLALRAIDPELAGPLFSTPEGWGILGAGAVLELMGAMMIRRIVSIEL